MGKETKLTRDHIYVSDKDDLVASDATVQKAIEEFVIRCGGRTLPVLVRPAMISACATVPNGFEMLPEAQQAGVQYTEKFLDMFAGHEHAIRCCVCQGSIECASDNDHGEVGAFMCLFKHDLDHSAGGLVFGICETCAKQEDDALYERLAQVIGGRVEPVVKPRFDSVSPPISEYPARGASMQLAENKDPNLRTEPAVPVSQDDLNLLVGTD